MRVGDSIRRSIDAGLSQSRFGIVVLSKAFFNKEWPQYELDGLAEREMSGPDTVILPVWYDVAKADVQAFSLPLANRVAARGSEGIETVVERIVAVVHPEGSPLIEAWRKVVEWGHPVPTITDPYWLRVVAASNRVPGFGAAVPEDSTWSVWSFPLPPREEEEDAEAWGERLAWTALQLNWVATAERENICVTTRPDVVYEFVMSHPGLLETCADFPDMAAEYAPQLTIPQFSGELAGPFDEALASSVAQAEERRRSDSRFGTALTSDNSPPLCDEEWCLRHPTFGGYRSSTVASSYFSGTKFGPTVSPWDHPDHLFWLLSSASSWLPDEHRRRLREGMAEWGPWPWMGRQPQEDWTSVGALWKALHRAVEGKNFSRTVAVTRDLRARIQLAIERLALPETVQKLEERFLAAGFMDAWIKTQLQLRHRRSKSAV